MAVPKASFVVVMPRCHCLSAALSAKGILYVSKFPVFVGRAVLVPLQGLKSSVLRADAVA